MLHELQEAFRCAAFETDGMAADGALLTDLVADGSVAAGERLAIYRNNTLASLISVLGAAYPVRSKVVGAANFRVAAYRYVRAHPPRRPQLSAYGDRFADFLDAFEPARSTPFLADLARLEWAHNVAYFAADAEPLTAWHLRDVPPASYAALKFELHPSAALIASRFAVDGIWQAHQGSEVPDPAIEPYGAAMRILVIRPQAHVRHESLANGDFTFLLALTAGVTLERAAQAAQRSTPDFDLLGSLLHHLTHGTFRAFSGD